MTLEKSFFDKLYIKPRHIKVLTGEMFVIIFIILYLTGLSCSFMVPNEANLPISPELYRNLSTYAHLIDISYCISPMSKIRPPFQCENSCQDFPNTELIFQWSTNDFILADSRFATSGYIAVNHDLRKILVVFRGTRSFKDSIVDINAEMDLYRSPGCIGCKVHRGFLSSAVQTQKILKESLEKSILRFEDYEIQMMGHSLGGAVSVLIAIKISRIFKDRVVKCLTMGQPMIGNSLFSSYIDEVFNLRNVDFEKRHLVRVTHLDDPVVKLPVADTILFGDLYFHSSNEIFINEAGNPVPSITNVLQCHGRSDPNCAAGMRYTRDNTNHLNYFRRMGKCGFGFNFEI